MKKLVELACPSNFNPSMVLSMEQFSKTYAVVLMLLKNNGGTLVIRLEANILELLSIPVLPQTSEIPHSLRNSVRSSPSG